MNVVKNHDTDDNCRRGRPIHKSRSHVKKRLQLRALHEFSSVVKIDDAPGRSLLIGRGDSLVPAGWRAPAIVGRRVCLDTGGKTARCQGQRQYCCVLQLLCTVRRQITVSAGWLSRSMPVI